MEGLRREVDSMIDLRLGGEYTGVIWLGERKLTCQ